jgi:hypothetical protein
MKFIFGRRLHAPKRVRPPRIVPRLESLEDRTVPSTLTVTNNLDTGIAGDGSLRGEIAAASSGDTINFAPSLAGQTITLTQGELAISQSLDIEGLGANQLTVSGNSQSRVFDITASNASVTIAGLTISGGLSAAGSGITNVGTLTVNSCTLTGNVANNDFGGAIENLGTLTVNFCTLSGNAAYFGAALANAGTLAINNSAITGNSAVGAPLGYPTTSGYVAPAGNGCGGGIYVFGGTLSINSSTIADNEAIGGSDPVGNAGTGAGGGLYIAGGTVTIDNSTLADNEAIGGNSGGNYAPGNGGGIENQGGTVTIDNSTLAGNQASGNGYYSPGQGGAISNDAGTVSINNSTIADNQANTLIGTLGGGNGGGISGALQMYDTILADNTASYAPDLDGNVTSLGHNLIGNTAGGSGFAASDLLNVNPQLGPLQNNGGPTQTMALLPGSAAINAGDNTGAPAFDQRGTGFPRVVNGIIDIGAFEVQSNSSQTGSLAVSAFPSPIQAGTSGSFTVTALNPDGSIDTNYTGTVHFTSSDSRPGLPADYTFTAANAGTHTFSATLFTAGAQAIAATDTSTGEAGAEVGITVTPGMASQLAFVQQPSTATAGQAISPAVVVEVEDAYGNLVSGNSSTVTVTLSSGTFASGSATVSAAASGGVATFSALTIDKASSCTLTATDGSLTAPVSAHFSVTPAAASKFVLTGPSSVRAGVSFSLTLTVEDAYGNVVTGYTGTVHFTSTDNRALLPANYTFTAGDAGVHTFTGLVLHKKGKQKITVTATDTLNSSLTANVIVNVL